MSNMNDDLGQLPVPRDANVRTFPWFKTNADSGLSGELVPAISDAGFRATVTLMWAAWKQVPAGTLPLKDDALCRLAGLGSDVRKWRKIRDEVLQAFVKIDDRWCHLELCEQVKGVLASRKDTKGRVHNHRANGQDQDKKGGYSNIADDIDVTRYSDVTSLSPSQSRSQSLSQEGEFDKKGLSVRGNTREGEPAREADALAGNGIDF